ncbi:cytochrome P450 [Phaeosphaeriaceae sp. PMI808]|nr:cytochrome P450 [Phaeosphaeriaceae sp. PMI808]
MLWRSNQLNENFQNKKIPRQVSLLWSMIYTPFWSPMRFVLSASIFRNPDPVRINIFGKGMIVVQGYQNMQAMLSEKNLSNVSLANYLMRHAFNMSRDVTATHYSEPGNEKDITHYNNGEVVTTHQKFATMHRKFLTGPGAAAFWKRFEYNLGKKTKGIVDNLGTDWAYWEDFFSFFQKDITAEVINAICGKTLLQQNPGFLEDFWTFSNNLRTFLARLPRLFASRPHSARERVISALQDWQSWAKCTYDAKNMYPNGDDDCWGSAFFRERYDLMLGLDKFDARAAASQELAFLYALNSNAIVATFWGVLEVFQDKDLLRRVRNEVASCTVSHEELVFDAQRLLEQPLMQAIYAETLRLRGHGFFVRVAQSDVHLTDWFIPKGSVTFASSTPGHMNPDIWCQRTPRDSSSVNAFCPERFLKEGQFCTKRTEGLWMPFGAGWNMCPGRHFAKQQAIFTMAVLVSNFDCEILSERPIDMSTDNFGVGILGPRGKVRVRIRRHRE